MNERIKYAKGKLDEAERNGEDVATLRYWAGYLDALCRTDAELSAARAERDVITKRMTQLEQENAALLFDLKKVDIDCDFCRHNGAAPEECDVECIRCKLDCPCKTCRDNSNYVWRGMKEDVV